MPELNSASEVAREIGCRPRDISDGFFQGILDDRRIHIIAGRGVIPRDYIPENREIIAARGKIRGEAQA